MAIAAEAYRDFEKEALMLPIEVRSHLASVLLESLEEDDSPITAEWSHEIGERVAAIDEGRIVLAPHEEVMARFAAKLESRRSGDG